MHVSPADPQPKGTRQRLIRQDTWHLQKGIIISDKNLDLHKRIKSMYNGKDMRDRKHVKTSFKGSREDGSVG